MMSRRQFIGVVGGAGVGALAAAAASSSTAEAAVARRVLRTVRGRNAKVGQVFDIRRTIPGEGTGGVLEQVDPFLMLDHFDFTIAPGQLGGLAPHPHKGIETVTVLLDGAIEHGDSLGNRAVLEEGGVQWMTAAGGIVHEENPADVLREKGGRVRGVQLWVNLPRAHKVGPPGYQDRDALAIPVAADAGVKVRVLAGAIDDVISPLVTHTPLALMDVDAGPGALVELRQPRGWTAFVHVVAGDVDLDGTALGEAMLADLDRDGNVVRFVAGSRGARVLVGGGAPIGEVMARRGPFVMSTEAEIQQAYADYRAGRMGRVANPTYDRIKLPE